MRVRMAAVIVWAVLALGVDPTPSLAQSREATDIARRAAELRHTPAMKRWEQIPWLTDLNEGIAIARREKRPLFLMAVGDEPLERC